MLKKRLIAVLIILEGRIVQSIQFKLTNVIHWKPVTAVDFFDKWAIDEMVVLDVGRNQDKREKFYEIVQGLSEKCFVPLTVGGWVDSVEEMRKLLRMGADKVTLNTQAVRTPELITACAKVFGSQCVVLSIDAKIKVPGKYEVYIDRGREATHLDPVEWVVRAQNLGAGEIFLNCIDRDGFRQGYDLELIRRVAEVVDIPVIAMGGVLNWQHLAEGISIAKADAVAAANIFHYTEHSTKKAKKYLRECGIDVR
jgi:cyclase